MELDRIYEGSCIDHMRGFPEKVFDTIITSPPYYGLRSYGTEPVIWGGDDSCQHEWHEQQTGLLHENRNGLNGTVSAHKELHGKHEGTANICHKCGAWRGELGLEPTMAMYLDHLLIVFAECKRVLKDTGVLFVNIGDSYNTQHKTGTTDAMTGWKHGELAKDYQGRAGEEALPSKTLLDIPFRLSVAMVDSGWIKRNTIIWHKPNCMPQSCRDRFTVDFEYIFMFVKQGRYYFEQQFEPYAEATLPRMERGVSDSHKWSDGADGQTRHGMSKPRKPVSKDERIDKGNWSGSNRGLGEGGFTNLGNLYGVANGRTMRAVWDIPTSGLSDAHFAVFPEALAKRMLISGCPEFICNKCGKPREKIWDTSERINTRGGENVHNAKSGNEGDPNLSFHKSDMSIYRQKIIYKEDGYTDCGCNAGWHSGVVYDCFFGAGTTGVVAKENNRHYVGSEMNPEYVAMAERRIAKAVYQPELF